MDGQAPGSQDASHTYPESDGTEPPPPQPRNTPPPGSEAEQHFFAQLALHHGGDGVVVTDSLRRTLWINPAFSALTGYQLEDLLGKDPGEVLQGRDTDPDTAERIREATHHRQELRCEVQNYTRSGTAYWVDLRIVPVHDDTGRHTHYVSTLRDITERKSLEDQNEEMRQAEAMRQDERQLLAQTSEWLYSARSSDELMMVVRRAMHTLIPEADGALYVYATARDTLDLAASWGSMPAFTPRIAPDDCWALRRGRAYSYGMKAIEFPCDHVHGDAPPPFFCLPIIAHGETIGLLHLRFDGFEETGMLRHMREGVLRNRWELGLICAEQISLAIANVRLRHELHDRSVRDPLTGIWNRRWFLDAMQRALRRNSTTGNALSLILLDVDHFKRFNDDHGHDAGDLVLQAVGEVLRDHLPEHCQPCRLGGEEFVILCNDTDADAAAALAARIATALSSQTLQHDRSALPPVTVSGGIATAPHHGQTAEGLLRAADQALYAAKNNGRNRIECARTQVEQIATPATPGSQNQSIQKGA